MLLCHPNMRTASELGCALSSSSGWSRPTPAGGARWPQEGAAFSLVPAKVTRGSRASASLGKQPTEQAFSLTELLALLAIIGLLIGLVVPSLNRMKEHDRRNSCADQLKEIGVGFVEHLASAKTNNHELLVLDERAAPREPIASELPCSFFRALSNEVTSPALFTCPSDNRVAAKSFAGMSNGNISYFAGLDAREENPQMFVAGDRNVTNGTALPADRILVATPGSRLGWTQRIHDRLGNVLLVDASVQQASTSYLRRLLGESGSTNRLAMP